MDLGTCSYKPLIWMHMYLLLAARGGRVTRRLSEALLLALFLLLQTLLLLLGALLHAPAHPELRLVLLAPRFRRLVLPQLVTRRSQRFKVLLDHVATRNVRHQLVNERRQDLQFVT